MLTWHGITENHFERTPEIITLIRDNLYAAKGKRNGDISPKGKRGKKRGRGKTSAGNRFNFPRHNPFVDIVSEGEWLKGNS